MPEDGKKKLLIVDDDQDSVESDGQDAFDKMAVLIFAPSIMALQQECR
ncbi:MAG: hypothetical protein U0930_17000 [Pirellulales bacterium]